MAKNIKKRSASHIYFGVNKLTGELKHISEVPSGQKCNCICAACLQPFEARKGTRRRHHFAHVSNYECMYASEVAIYKAIAEALKQSGFLTLPPVMLRFPAWHDPELLQEARRLKIDSAAFECEPLSYPPLLRVTMQGTPLRILLDFDRYYDDDDRVELAEEAKVEDYSLLLISMPKIEQDTEFTPDRLHSALQDNDRTEWVFSRLEEQWKQKYYAVAVSPPEHGTGNLCPISFGKYKGKYSARWIDCAHCHFNVAQPPCCLCVAGAGIQKKKDFKRDLQDRLFDIDKIRRTNEEETGCVKNEKDLSSEDLSILVQHRMLLGLWSQPVLRKRSWMRNISGSARAMTRPLKNGQWIATIGDGSCVRFAAELSRMRRCPITVAREVQTRESVPIVHEMVVANPHSWLDIIRMMVYY